MVSKCRVDELANEVARALYEYWGGEFDYVVDGNQISFEELGQRLTIRTYAEDIH